MNNLNVVREELKNIEVYENVDLLAESTDVVVSRGRNGSYEKCVSTCFSARVLCGAITTLALVFSTACLVSKVVCPKFSDDNCTGASSAGADSGDCSSNIYGEVCTDLGNTTMVVCFIVMALFGWVYGCVHVYKEGCEKPHCPAEF